MAGFNNVGYNPIKTIDTTGSKLDDVDAQIASLNKSIPEQTSTKSEKEKAVKVKNEIIKLLKQKLAVANKEGNVSLAQNINNNIRIVEEERNVILDEIKTMTVGTSIYNQEQSFAPTKGADKVSIWTQQKA